MELIIFYLLTVLLSKGMQISFTIKILKNCADAGYILNLKNTKSINNPNNFSYLNWIPILNILCMFYIGKIYIDNVEDIIHNYYVNGIIVEMTNEEKEKYAIDSSFRNLMKILKKKDEVIDKNDNQKLLDAINNGEKIYTVVYKCKDNGKIGIILATIDTNREINILKAMGEAINLSLEEQKNYVVVEIKQSVERIVKKYGGTDNLTKKLFNVDDINNNEEAKMWKEKIESILPKDNIYEQNKGKSRTRKFPK